MENKKELVEKKVISYVIKSIETHVELLKKSSIVIKNQIEQERLIESVEHLNKAKALLNSDKKQIALSKRNAYARYQNSKKELKELKNNNATNKEILEKDEECKKYLEYYKNLKDLYSMYEDIEL